MKTLIAVLAAAMLSIPAAGAADGLRYVAIGDSITAHRVGVVGYVEQLAADPTVPFTRIRNAGVPGATTADTLKTWDARVAPHLPAATVSIMLGMNDHIRDPSQPRPRVTVGEFVANMTRIIRRLRTAGVDDIVVLSPPFVRSNFTTGIGPNEARLMVYIEALRVMCDRLEVRFLDLHQVTGRLVGWDRRLWSTAQWTDNHDGIHPTTAVHTLMLPYIREAITAERR